MNGIPAPVQPASPPTTRPQYVIYTYARAATGERSDRWQRHGSLPERGKALRIARNLFDSGRYARIEVRHQVVDRHNRRIDNALKIFGRSGALRFGAAGIAVFAAMCSVTVLVVAALA